MLYGETGMDGDESRTGVSRSPFSGDMQFPVMIVSAVQHRLLILPLHHLALLLLQEGRGSQLLQILLLQSLQLLLTYLQHNLSRPEAVDSLAGVLAPVLLPDTSDLEAAFVYPDSCP